MERLIGISRREELNSLLTKLDPTAVPLWGKMKPQQMIEHLIGEVEYTNGKKIAVCTRPEQDAARDKNTFVYSDFRIPKNVILGELPAFYRYNSLEISVKQLMKELEDFDGYFKQQSVTAVHFSFGAMDHNEWLIWHSKHFTHHLEQFGLLPL